MEGDTRIVVELLYLHIFFVAKPVKQFHSAFVVFLLWLLQSKNMQQW